MTESKILSIQRNVEASLAIEKAYPSSKAKEINKQFLLGNMTSAKAIQNIKSLYIGGDN